MKKTYVILEEGRSILSTYSWLSMDENGMGEQPATFIDYDTANAILNSLASDQDKAEIVEMHIEQGYYHTEQQAEEIHLEDDDLRVLCSDGWVIATEKLHPNASPANGMFCSFSGDVRVFVTEE